MLACYFCGSTETSVRHRNLPHKVARDFGPFDLFVCRDCGSLSTANPPDTAALATFYQHYEQHRPDWYKAGQNAGALGSQYGHYARHVSKRMAPGADWVDIGAGHGEVANLVADTFGNGTAIDIGPRPEGLSQSVAYYSVDMNGPGWAKGLARQFDNVFSVAVWEHVLHPADFATECLSLVRPGGTLTLICPDYGSSASKLLGTRWPYFEPGEHISIPTKRGAHICLEAAARKLAINATVSVKSLNVRYSIRYLCEVLRLRRLARKLAADWSAPLPTGILTATVQRHQ